jgi:TetR/AcrR family transcriptional regulator, cholesterol catabolism regulator
MDLKARIISEAEALFCQYGIKRITMDDIAKHLGISKKTIYLHYKDKDDLVHMLITDMLSRETCEMDRNESDSQDAIKEMFLVVTHLRALLSKMNPMIFFDLQKYHPKSWLLFKNYRYEYTKNCIAKNLKRGIEEGLFRKEIDLEIISIMRMEQIDMIFNQIAYGPGKFNLSEVMTEITEHYLYGLCTIKGHQLINKYKRATEE